MNIILNFQGIFLSDSVKYLFLRVRVCKEVLKKTERDDGEWLCLNLLKIGLRLRIPYKALGPYKAKGVKTEGQDQGGPKQLHCTATVLKCVKIKFWSVL